MNFLIHSLNRFVLKKNIYALLVFFSRVPYMQIYPLNASKLDWEENIFDFCAELIAFRIEIFINLI